MPAPAYARDIILHQPWDHFGEMTISLNRTMPEALPSNSPGLAPGNRHHENINPGVGCIQIIKVTLLLTCKIESILVLYNQVLFLV